MKIYDEITKQEITDPDLSKGRIYDGVIVTGHTEDRYEVMEGTITESRPRGLRRLVPGHDIAEPCQWYHTYTEEEMAQKAQPDTVDQKIQAAMQPIYKAIMEVV